MQRRQRHSASDPGLTDAGRARADALREALRDAHVNAIITTQFARTRKTAEPLAETRHRFTPVVVQAGSDTAAHVRAVAAAIHAQSVAGVIVVVGHSNTITPLVAALGGPTLPDICDGESHAVHAGAAARCPARLMIGPARLIRRSRADGGWRDRDRRRAASG